MLERVKFANLPKGQSFAKFGMLNECGVYIMWAASAGMPKTTFLLIRQTFVPPTLSAIRYSAQCSVSSQTYISVSSEVYTTTASDTVTSSIVTTVKGILLSARSTLTLLP